MLAAPRIAYMPRKQHDQADEIPLPRWARAIKARRNFLGKSGMDIDNETGGVVYQKLVSYLETAKKEPRDIATGQFDALLKALNWTPRQFVEETGYDIFYDDTRRPTNRVGLPPVKNVMPVGPVVKVRYLGSVSGGMHPGGQPIEMEPFDTPVNFLEGANPDDCFWVDVDGTSMACDDVRRHIPPGTRCLIDSTKRPESGAVVVVELHRDGEVFNILKVYRPGEKFVTLESYNSQEEPIILREGDYAEIKGVMIGKYQSARAIKIPVMR